MFCSLKGGSGFDFVVQLAWPSVHQSSHYLSSIFMIINFEQVHNYFERLVFEAVASLASSYPDYGADMLADVACVALNRLPARYLRHDVDMMFYLTEQERSAINDALDEALGFAFAFVGERQSKRSELA